MYTLIELEQISKPTLHGVYGFNLQRLVPSLGVLTGLAKAPYLQSGCGVFGAFLRLALLALRTFLGSVKAPKLNAPTNRIGTRSATGRLISLNHI